MLCKFLLIWDLALIVPQSSPEDFLNTLLQACSKFPTENGKRYSQTFAGLKRKEEHPGKVLFLSLLLSNYATQRYSLQLAREERGENAILIVTYVL